MNIIEFNNLNSTTEPTELNPLKRGVMIKTTGRFCGVTLILATLISGCGSALMTGSNPGESVSLMAQDPPAVVNFVDLSRYTGLWYEVASYPAYFSVGCVGTTATYTLQPDGNISLLNQCFTLTRNGFRRTITGVAKVTDSTTNAKLSIFFEGSSFGAPYWIIDLDQEDYQYAVVSDPARLGLFILSRTPSLNKETMQGIRQRLEAQGYNLRRLKPTRQPGA
jgi:apolipoprotein D and lipocalin family protein